jgi:drug/metabolite transporter (DMT)-like permease
VGAWKGSREDGAAAEREAMPARCGGTAPLTVALTLTIAAAWVGTSQLARQAEQSPGCLSAASCAHFIVWLNGSSWVFLGLPWCALQLVASRRRRAADGATAAQSSSASSSSGADDSSANGARREEAAAAAADCTWPQVLAFFALALGTNYCYVFALEYIPASLNTAVFSTSPVLTLALSVQFLDTVVLAPRAKWASALLSIAGVALISQPWADLSPEHPFGALASAALDQPGGASRPIGCALSLAAAAGSACYQVYFKKLLGGRLGPVESGLFLSKLGLLIFVLLGAVLAVLMHSQVYVLDLESLPWPLLAGTAGLSLLFNFATTFGLSISSPVVVSLATQLGIPLNLMIDVFIDPSGSAAEALDDLTVAGVAIMLASFMLSAAADHRAAAAAAAAAAAGDSRGPQSASSSAAAAALIDGGIGAQVVAIDASDAAEDNAEEGEEEEEDRGLLSS